MYIAEIIVSILLIISTSFLGINYLNIEDNNYKNYLNNLEKQSIQISLTNYVENISTGQGYLSISGYDFIIGDNGNYYFSCKEKTGYLINTNISYTGNFCYINFENTKIYNFKLK